MKAKANEGEYKAHSFHQKRSSVKSVSLLFVNAF